MPSIDDFFPVKWLKAEHIITADGRRPVITVEIAGAGREMLYDKKERENVARLIVEFVGRDKRLILNKTQAEAIAAQAGKDYTKWRGQRIAIQAGTAHNGKPTIVIMRPSAPAAEQPAAAAATEAGADAGTNTNTPNQYQEAGQEQDQDQ